MTSAILLCICPVLGLVPRRVKRGAKSGKAQSRRQDEKRYSRCARQSEKGPLEAYMVCKKSAVGRA